MTSQIPTIIAIGEAMIEFSKRQHDCWAMGFAGDSLNVLWAMRALLERDSADLKFFSRVGTDPQSESFVQFLTESDIGTELLQRDSDRNMGLYTIATDADGERSFSYWRSASAARHLADDIDRLHTALASAQMTYVSGISLAILSEKACDHLIHALADIRPSGAKLAFDPNIRPALWSDMDRCRETVEKVAGLADIVLPTHDDEAKTFGDVDAAATIARYAALGVPEIIVKDGIRPTHFRAQGAAGSIEVANPQRAIDTTGAGDGFNGGYLAARFMGHAVPESIALAQAVSGRVVMTKGALVPMQDLKDLANLQGQ